MSVRGRLAVNPMVSLLYLEDSFNLSGQDLVQRRAERLRSVSRRNRQGGASPLQ